MLSLRWCAKRTSAAVSVLLMLSCQRYLRYNAFDFVQQNDTQVASILCKASLLISFGMFGFGPKNVH